MYNNYVSNVSASYGVLVNVSYSTANQIPHSWDETRQDGAESLLTFSSRIINANENKIVKFIGTINLTDEPLTVGAVDVVAALSADG